MANISQTDWLIFFIISKQIEYIYFLILILSFLLHLIVNKFTAFLNFFLSADFMKFRLRLRVYDIVISYAHSFNDDLSLYKVNHSLRVGCKHAYKI